MLPKEYIAQAVESKWQEAWRSSGVYNFDRAESRQNTYVIDTPPPTVSGLLHMGHIFSYTQADIIARFQRMYGKNVFYPIGYDDNGLPTERLVEKVKGIYAKNLPREEFIKICQEVVSDSENEFRALFSSIALSVDWRYEYQTISSDSRALSQMSFIDLYNKSHIERRKSPTFWDPVDRTAIAQAEIEDKERQSFMNNIAFKTTDGQQITIATTRPEMLSACVAVFYHPTDARYSSLKAKKAIVPIFGQEVPLLPDEDVAIDKGTGLVMCCTFGDAQDIVWWKRHNLELKEIITLTGQLQNSGLLDGLYVKDARNKVIEELKNTGELLSQEAITQSVKCAERSGAPLELVTTEQWYVKILDKKEKIIAAARAATWRPDYMLKRLEIWANGLNQDWCISRQRYFGVPFPVWYSKRAGEEGKILIADPSQLPVDPLQDLPIGYARHEVMADCDVMDTWATSAISPQLSSKAITKELALDYDLHQKLYPADLRPQAHEIIRTWAFYTITKSLLHEEKTPWANVMISGWCLAADGNKMSKSKGNVVTPKDLIIAKGADIIRYWASTSKLGVDITYSEELFKIGKKLINKLWNASKFAAQHLDKLTSKPTTAKADVEAQRIVASLDLWILSKLAKTIDLATKDFLEYEYADARSTIEAFFWNDFCDNYLELIKGRVYAETDSASKQSALLTIYHILNALFRLFAPVMPHICEELNEGIFNGEMVTRRSTWPKSADHFYNEQSEKDGTNATKVLELVRKFKSAHTLSLNAKLEEVTYYGDKISDSAEADVKFAAQAINLRHSSGVGETSMELNPYTITAKTCQEII